MQVFTVLYHVSILIQMLLNLVETAMYGDCKQWRRLAWDSPVHRLNADFPCLQRQHAYYGMIRHIAGVKCIACALFKIRFWILAFLIYLGSEIMCIRPWSWYGKWDDLLYFKNQLDFLQNDNITNTDKCTPYFIRNFIP